MATLPLDALREAREERQAARLARILELSHADHEREPNAFRKIAQLAHEALGDPVPAPLAPGELWCPYCDATGARFVSDGAGMRSRCPDCGGRGRVSVNEPLPERGTPQERGEEAPPGLWLCPHHRTFDTSCMTPPCARQ